MRKLRQALTPPMWVRWPLFTLFCLASGPVFALLVRLIDTQDPQQLSAAFSQLHFWLTALFLALIVSSLAFAAHSLFVGCLLPGTAAVLLAFVNYFKMLITSIPLSIGDFTLIGQVGEIASLNAETLKLSTVSVWAIVLLVLWLLLALFFSGPLRLHWGWSCLWAAAAALIFTGTFWWDAEPLIYTHLGVDTSRNISQAAANRACGPVLGLWRSLYQQVNRTMDSDYSLQQMEDAVGRAEEFCVNQTSTVSDRRQPNIIMILSESFSDPTTLPGVTYETDPVADFHALQTEGVSGAFYTRTLGYGTCNIELEIFTGINTCLMTGEDLYSWDPEVFSRLPSVVALLREAGYSTAMLHTYNDEIYHRTGFFHELGFEELYFSGDFDLFYPPAMEAEDYWAYMETRIRGRYYSDDLLADGLISLYEQKTEQEDGPLFLYGISMENHSSYSGGKYPEEQLTVSPQSGLTGEAAESLLALSQGVSDASESLGKLVDYFRNVDEPTVIVFYGDHRAGLGLTEGSTVYSELGMVPAERLTWSVEEVASLYYADYLIWSNDPDYLPGEAGSAADTSSNYFGTVLLDLAQAEKPLYWQLLSQLSELRLCDTIFYHLGRDGVLSDELPNSGMERAALDLLAGFLSDAIYGEQYVTAEIGGKIR